MNVLRFRRGIKDWKTTYEVNIDFEYTADLEKRLTRITFYRPDLNRSITLPWSIFEPYLNGNEKTTYVDKSGIVIRVIDEGLFISDSRAFSIVVQRDQMTAIRIAANRIKEDISKSVERILREFSYRRSASGRV